MGKLTHQQIVKTAPGEKPVKLADGDGLYLYITPAGGRSWRLKYRLKGTERKYVIGKFPEISLSDARRLAFEARRSVALGVDPCEARKKTRASAADLFETIARAWHDSHIKAWSLRHGQDVINRLTVHVFPRIGKTPIADITSVVVLDMLRDIEARGANETTRRVRQIVSQVFRYAMPKHVKHNVVADIIPKDVLAPVVVTNRAAILDPDKVGALLRAIYAYDGTVIVRCALKLALHVFTRPGELRHAEWSEINFMRERWEIPGEKMKRGLPLIVPLSRQALDILREVHRVTGRGRWVFPSGRGPDRPMSSNGILAALRRMGFEKSEMSGHGVRATARTLIREELGYDPDVIETQLAHAKGGKLRGAYDRTLHLKERTAMMEAWSDYLDTLRTSTKAATGTASPTTTETTGA